MAFWGTLKMESEAFLVFNKEPPFIFWNVFTKVEPIWGFREKKFPVHS